MKNKNTGYVGSAATKYDAIRSNSKTWRKEDEGVHFFLSDLRKHVLTVIDLPVGTGRFFPHYQEFGLNVVGIDVSKDMLKQAKNEASSLNFDVTLIHGDVLGTDLPEVVGDIVICTRFLNLIDFPTFQTAFRHLTKLSSRYLLLEIADDSFPSKRYFRHPLDAVFSCFQAANTRVIGTYHVNKSKNLYLLEGEKFVE